MARPVTIFTGQWADMSLEEICKTASEMGYEGLEIATWGQINCHEVAANAGYVEEMKASVEKKDLKGRLPGAQPVEKWRASRGAVRG